MINEMNLDSEAVDTEDSWAEAGDEDVAIEPPETVEDALEAILSTVRRLGVASRFTRPNGMPSLALIPGDDAPLPLRDLGCVLEACPELLDDDTLAKTCREFAACQLPDGQFPDRMRADGTPIYNPDDDPDTQLKNTETAQFMIWLAWHAVQRGCDAELAAELVPRLVKGVEGLPRSDKTHLLYVDEASDDFGVTCPFAPSARKRGDLLSSSLLLVQAYQQLADIVQHLGRDGDGDMWRAEAQLVAKRVRMYFWDKTPGLFRAATRGCTEHDVWGSIFSVYLNVATSGQLVAISRYCSENYADLVLEGHVKGLPVDEHWSDCDMPAGEFENGGFWSGAAGWLAYTVDILDPALADRVIVDLATSLVSNGVFKMYNAKGVGRFRDYLPSAAAPLPGILKMFARRRKRQEQAALLDEF